MVFMECVKCHSFHTFWLFQVYCTVHFCALLELVFLWCALFTLFSAVLSVVVFTPDSLLDSVWWGLRLSADPSFVLCQTNWPEVESHPCLWRHCTENCWRRRQRQTTNLYWLMLGNLLRASSMLTHRFQCTIHTYTWSIFHSFRPFSCPLPDVLSCVILLWRPLRLFSPCSETAVISPTGHFISLVIHMFFGTKNILQVEMKCVQERLEARGDLFYGVWQGVMRFLFKLAGGESPCLPDSGHISAAVEEDMTVVILLSGWGEGLWTHTHTYMLIWWQ